MKKLILFLGMICFQLAQTAELPQSYLLNIQFRQYDRNNYGKYEISYELKDFPLNLEQFKPGLMSFSVPLKKNYLFTINLIDFNFINQEKRIRFDFAVAHFQEVMMGGKPSTLGLIVCESRLNYADLLQLNILEKTDAEAWCTDDNLQTIGIVLKKVPTSSN